MFGWNKGKREREIAKAVEDALKRQRAELDENYAKERQELEAQHTAELEDATKKTRDDVEEEFNKSLTQRLEELVHDKVSELKTSNDEHIKANKDLESQLKRSQKQNARYTDVVDAAAKLKEDYELASQAINSELVPVIAQYWIKDSVIVTQVVSAMDKSKKSMLYLKEFFQTLYDVDKMVSKEGEVNLGLRLLDGIVKGCGDNFDIDVARAYSLYVFSELGKKPEGVRSGSFNVYYGQARAGKFGNGQKWYQQEQVHHDYVLNLTETERELISFRDEAYEGSWTAMLSVLKRSDDTKTRVLSLREDPELTIPLIKKLREYEQEHDVVLKHEKPY